MTKRADTLATTANREYHENGRLKYVETIAAIPESLRGLYNYHRVHSNGTRWIRVGKCEKRHDNGVIAWTLNYDEKGKVIKQNNSSRRKDGTIIQY